MSGEPALLQRVRRPYRTRPAIVEGEDEVELARLLDRVKGVR